MNLNTFCTVVKINVAGWFFNEFFLLYKLVKLREAVCTGFQYFSGSKIIIFKNWFKKGKWQCRCNFYGEMALEYQRFLFSFYKTLLLK
jgi:hypothetical protein